MNEKLYIIGNGFDIYHGLSTRYESFAFYLQDNAREIYDLLIQYYSLPHLDKKNPDSVYGLCLWSEFEKTLADLDFEQVLDDNTDYLPNISSDDFRDRDWHSYQIEMEMIVDKLTKDLFSQFKEFINSREYPELEESKRLNLDESALFFNFNYTNTLGHYYQIDESNILYIHNKANSQYTLVLGHSINPESFRIDEQKQQEMADDYDFSYESGKEEIMTYFSKSFKPTEKIINENLLFFNKCSAVKKIYILGHSLSEIDEPYIVKILDSVTKDVSLIVTYYSEAEKESHKSKLMELGVEEERITVIKMNEL